MVDSEGKNHFCCKMTLLVAVIKIMQSSCQPF